MHLSWSHKLVGSFLLVLSAAACSEDDAVSPVQLGDTTSAALRTPGRDKCAPDNGGITLPPDFCAIVVADLKLGGSPAAARHLAVTPSGDVFVAINSPRNNQPAFGIIGLRDADGDGVAEQQSQFSPGLGGSGLAWSNGMLYFGANDRVLRFTMPAGQLTPIGDAAVVVSGLVSTGDHISKTVVVPNPTTLYVNIGSASNACQVANRQAQSPGVFPCPELPIRAGVWQFNALGTNQAQSDGQHYATGLRNMVALAVHPRSGELWGVQHGRDMLFENWPQFFTVEEDAVLPAEEMIRITRGSDNGWPYCYFDAVFEKKKVLAPEYGGDGAIVSGNGIDCATMNQPLATFGAHWAPNGMHFYNSSQFPSRYRNGAFVVFHGGFDRAPLPNEGYKVMFVPFNAAGNPTGDPETFADGFAGPLTPLPANAVHRPVGVTEGPDGSLYISDDKAGRIWRIIYTGQ
jgi:glucose/arabinose dehydrogenase